jgi:hypothetical protein
MTDIQEPTPTKDRGLGPWGNAIAFLCVCFLAYLGITNYIGQPSPQPTPTPSPTVTASPTPSPSPSPSPTVAPTTTVRTSGLTKPAPDNAYAPPLAAQARIRMAKGETRARILKVDGPCLDVQPRGLNGVLLRFHRLEAVKTAQPSFKGAAVGDHYDALLPIDQDKPICSGWSVVSVSVDRASTLRPGEVAAVEFGGFRLEVEVNGFSMPARPTMPFYIGVGSYALLLGHRIEIDSAGRSQANVTVQGPLVMQYVNALRDARVEPFGQALAAPPVKADGLLNLDQWAVGSFRQTSITGAIAPPMALGGPFASVPWVIKWVKGAKSYDSLSACQADTATTGTCAASSPVLSAWERTIKAEPGLKDAWAYLTDEPNPDWKDANNYDPGLALTAQRVAAQEQLAPTLRSMVVHHRDARLAGLDVAVPQFEQVSAIPIQAGDWAYGACPSHGSCSLAGGTPTGTPDLTLEQSTVHARAYPLVCARLGTRACLYYSATQLYSPVSRDMWTQPFDFGGNHDGNLFYACRAGERGFTAHTACPSLRLFMIREGMYDLEYALASNVLATLVPDQYKWSRDNAAYDALR